MFGCCDIVMVFYISAVPDEVAVATSRNSGSVMALVAISTKLFQELLDLLRSVEFG